MLCNLCNYRTAQRRVGILKVVNTVLLRHRKPVLLVLDVWLHWSTLRHHHHWHHGHPNHAIREDDLRRHAVLRKAVQQQYKLGQHRRESPRKALHNCMSAHNEGTSIRHATGVSARPPGPPRW